MAATTLPATFWAEPLSLWEAVDSTTLTNCAFRTMRYNSG